MLAQRLYKAGLAALSISTLYTILVFLFGTFDELQIKIFLTTIVLGVGSLVAFGSSGLGECGFRKDVSCLVTSLGVGSSLVAVALLLNIIWGEMPSGDGYLKAVFTTLVLSVACSYAATLLKMLDGRTLVNWLVYGSVCADIIVSLLLLAIVLELVVSPGEFYFRTLIVFAVLSIAGGIATPLTKRVISK